MSFSFIFGSAGNDTITTTLNSTGGALASNATNIGDQIVGMGGADLLQGGGGPDFLDGGDDNDTVYGGPQNDNIAGSDGDDLLYGDDGNDFIEGDAGQDTYVGGLGADVFYVTYAPDTYDDVGSTVLAPDVVADFKRAENDRLSIFDGSYSPAPGQIFTLTWGGDATGILGGQPILSAGQSLPGGTSTDSVFVYWIKRVFGGGWVVADLDRDGVLDAADFAVFLNTPDFVNISSDDFAPGTFTNQGAGPAATIIGTSGNDTIFPANVSAGVVGGAPTSGDDSIVAGDGNDSVFADLGDDTIRGEGGTDQLYGGFGDDLLDGGNGDDFLRGFTGNDLILGGAGFDVASYSGDPNPITAIATWNGLSGHSATVSSAASIDTLREIEAIDGTAFGDVIQATLTDPSAGFQARGYAGNDTIIGTADRSIGFLADYRVSGVTTGVIIDLAAGIALNDGFGGQDSLVNVSWVRGTDFADSILGTDGMDRFRGRGGSDYMDARGGDFDILDYAQSTAAVSVNLVLQRAQDGEGGLDTVIGFEEVRGSAGNDTIIGSGKAEQFQSYNGNDSIVGGGGQDRVIYNQTSGNVPAATQGVIVNLVTGIATDAWGGTDTLSSIERITGTAFADSMLGGAESNRFRGRAGNDTMDGGLGGDYVEYNNASTAVTVNLTTGVATDGEGGTDRLIAIEHVTGSNFADHLTGVAQLGRSTSLLRGGAGNDTLVGINGEYVVADYADQTTGLTISLGTGTANDGFGGVDKLIAIRGLNMFGDFADRLIGSPLDEWFSPSQGADYVNGWTGFDIIAYGGTDTGGVSVNLNAARARDTGGAIDTILAFEGVSTAFGDDTIIGSALGNLIDPGAGADSVVAGGGEDTISYSVGFSPNGTQYTANEAGDRLAVHGVTVDLYTSRATDFGGDVDTIFGFEHAAGSTGNDILRGNGLANALSGVEGDDTIEGRAGDDSLDGGLGNDRMLGGLGNDTYVVDSTEDTVFEALNQGIDIVRTSLATYALKANFENLTATSAVQHYFVGNVLDNIIIGGSGADTINGSTGNDTIDGGAGIDRLLGGLGDDLIIVTAGDLVFEALNQGEDTVQSTTGAFTLSANIETLVLTGTATNGIGNTLANTIVGNALSNILNGGVGDDTIDGGSGTDYLIGGTGRDFMTGGASSDRFRLTTLADSTVAAPDVIMDFNHDTEFDRIELNLLDANANIAGDQAFIYRGAAFTGAAGDLRVQSLGGNVYLAAGDVNGDSSPDFAMLIQSVTAPVSTWFVP